jgi:hypothetical protein
LSPFCKSFKIIARDLNQVVYEESMNKDKQQQLIEAYVDWLSPHPWTFIGTLTFRKQPSPYRADRLFRSWIDAMRKAEGTSTFSWFRVKETGAFGDNLHFHVLVGGLRNASKWPWMLLWDKLAGEANLSYFVTHLGGIRYILKSVRPDQPFDFDACLNNSEARVSR